MRTYKANVRYYINQTIFVLKEGNISEGKVDKIRVTEELPKDIISNVICNRTEDAKEGLTIE